MIRLLIVFIELLCAASSAFAQSFPTHLDAVRAGCDASCRGRHAIVFVHGIYGGSETFTNTAVSPPFSWSEQVPREIAGSPVDTFRAEYRTALLSWAKEDIASLDDIITTIYPEFARLRQRGYSSVNFVAHSLGGNVVKAYLHSVKSEEGHIERAKHGFVMTLGTPVNGASIANV